MTYLRVVWKLGRGEYLRVDRKLGRGGIFEGCPEARKGGGREYLCAYADLFLDVVE